MGLFCGTCWESIYNCNCSKISKGVKLPPIEIDDSISDIIQVLNKKGYKTSFCCGGHVRPDYILNGCGVYMYISFSNPKSVRIDGLEGEWKHIKYSGTVETKVSNLEQYKIYHGKTKSLQNKYNKEITQEVLDYVEISLEEKRNQLRKWCSQLPPKGGFL